MGWMLRGLDDDSRPFLGREAIRREVADGTSRWTTVGLVVDWEDWNTLYREAGLLPAKNEIPLAWASMLYDGPAAARGGEGHRQIGYVTSFCYSPVLQRHVGLARVRPEHAAPGTEVHLEIALNHSNTTVRASTAKTPLFNPARKTAKP
jgi:aminomethyltransferase